jgi:hypothetical protein
MTPAEAATVLALAVTLDVRLKPPSREDAQARAVAWSQTLDSDLLLVTAQRLVVDHYSETTDSLMPAHVNKAWRVLRKQQRQLSSDDAVRQSFNDAAANAIPMPFDVKELLQKTVKKTETP